MNYTPDPFTAFLNQINAAMGENIPTFYKTMMEQQKQKSVDARQSKQDERRREIESRQDTEWDWRVQDRNKPETIEPPKQPTPGSQAALINAQRHTAEYERGLRTDIGISEMTDEELARAAKAASPKIIPGDEILDIPEKFQYPAGMQDRYEAIVREINRRVGIVDQEQAPPFADAYHDDSPFRENVPFQGWSPPGTTVNNDQQSQSVTVQEAKQFSPDAQPGDLIWTPNGFVEVK